MLFNKLTGRRAAIVEDTPGVTRDRIYGECEWRGRKMILVDTGGIEPKTDDLILSQMRAQAELAIESADVIIFLCDVRAGLTADDREIAVTLKKSGKPVILCVNKCDTVGDLPLEFHRRIHRLNVVKLLEQKCTESEVLEGLDFIAGLDD